MTLSSTLGFSGPKVCRLTGVTYRQLDYWARTELVTPSIASATGSGSKRVYSYGDLLEVKVIKSLLDAGVSLARARQAVDCLRDALGADIASTTLVIGDQSTVLADVNGLVDLLRGGQGVFNILSMGSVVAELSATMASQSTSERESATA